MKFLASLSLVFLLISSATNAQQVNANTIAEMQKVLAGSGPVTKAEYDDFWNSLNLTKESEKAPVVKYMRDSFLNVQEYQAAIWACAEVAWMKRKESKCNKAQNSLTEIGRAKAPQMQQVIRGLEDNMNDLIKAAASRGEYKLKGPDAEEITITLEAIRSTKAVMDSTAARLRTILKARY